MTEPSHRLVGIGRSVAQALARPTDISALAAFRILLGLTLFVGLVRFMAQGWVRTQFVEPQMAFTYWGFGWVPRPPEWGMNALFLLLAACALCISAGLLYRLAAALFFVGFSWVQLLDVTNYLNHYYLVVLLSLLLTVLPLHRAWSVDAWWRPSIRRATLPAWMTWLLRFQVGVVYFYAGKAKFTGDWLLHAQPLGIWLSSRSETPIVGALFDQPWVAYAASWAGFLFDTTIVAFLLARRTRPFAYAVVILFHLCTHVLFDIGMFPWIMIVSALVFFSPTWPRKLLRRAPASPEGASAEARPLRRWALVLGATWCLVQVLVPLRHHLYPNQLLWAEQGMRFAWKVMVREKSGSVTFHVTDPGSGRTWQVTPQSYLTSRQVREMSAQPDLILQMAQRIARDFEARGIAGAEVRAEAWVSLNGRPPALLLDPTIDLARVRDGLGAAAWILPPPEGPPLALRGSSGDPSPLGFAPRNPTR